MARRHKPHRGVVLLVVLTLLTLLIVIGLTFAALSGQFRRAAEAGARKVRYQADPAESLDQAMYQVVRDTTVTSRSSLLGHSLLSDLLGNDGAAGIVQSWSQQLGGEFLAINFAALPLAEQPFGKMFPAQPGRYNGCTLTILGPIFTPGADGQAGRAGVDDDGVNGTDDPGELGFPGSDDRSLIADSARIVRYDFDSSALTGTLMVEWSAGEGGLLGFPRPGTRLLVNGRPLNGTGAGYVNNAPYTLDATMTVAGENLEVALLPHYRSYSFPAPPNSPDLGGLDETWDAVDYQNMFLAMVPADVSAGIIPSFHRPELVNYWLKRFGAEVLVPAGVTRLDLQVQAFRSPLGVDGVAGVNAYTGLNDDAVDDSGNPINTAILVELVRLKRMIIMRPLPEDHPNFVNGNRFVSTMGLPDLRPGVDQDLPQMVWDIDNDGDGIPDSVWLDIGLPIQTDDSGRRYRPLVAIMCQDLDSRLNVNAHSSPAHNSSLYADMSGWPAGVALQPSPANGTPAPFASVPLAAPQAVLLPRGLGVGPADVFLGHLLGANDFRNILTERYRHDVTVTGNAGGVSNIDDWMSQIKNLGLPRDYSNMITAYGSPPDVWGRGAVGVDYSGQPMSFYMGEAGETVGDPYEMVLNRGAAGYTDAPFTVSELERILRYHDIDASSLPDRLLNAASNSLAGNSPVARRNRRLVTTHSSHVPVITGMTPTETRADFVGAGMLGAGSHSILDLYALKLRDGGVAAAQLEYEMLKIVPWEIWHGQRMNVNRLLGNGRDDNGNDVVDEPLESDGGEIVWPDVPGNPGVPGNYDGGTNPIAFNYLNDDQGGILLNRYAPQIYARHLYCMMMLWTELVGPSAYLHPTEETLPAAARQELTAQRVAQWAINVVDFKDADAIMTPFEYDANPFNANGWLPMDGDPATFDGGVGSDRRLVWGAEYPDLLLTESSAFHDRRVKDTAYDRAGEGKRKPTSAPTPGDDDFDQYRIPQGSLFLELYCTRNQAANNTRFPRELYDVNGLLDLGRMAPADGSGVRFPVWQVVISEPLNDASSPESPLERSQRGAGTGKPDSTSFNPVEQVNPATGLVDPTYSHSMDLVNSLVGLPPAAADRINPERYVWFSPQGPPAAGTGLATFFCQNFAPSANPGNSLPQESFVKLAPGSYAVVGPREFTRIGASDDADAATYWDPSPHRILMSGNTFRMFDNDGNDRYTPLLSSIRNPLGIICGAYPPTTWADPATTAPTGIGLNVSEPLPNDPTVVYYEEPTYTFDTAAVVPDGYGDLSAPANTYPDEPFDNATGAPLADNNMQHTGTTLDYRAAFLQRLANPLEPYHVTRNPYITVDWTTIDLTVFNGEDDRTKTGFAPGSDPFDPQDDPDDDDTDNELRFSTRQRGGDAVFAGSTPPFYGPFFATTPDYQIWSPQTQEPFTTQEVPNPVTDVVTSNTLTHNFQHNLVHSLGYLNGTMGMPMPPAIVAAAPIYLGAPQQPFPWLDWNNRPMANPLELMQVPASTPSRLLHEFDIYRFGLTTNDPYESEPFNLATSPSSPADLQHFRGTFRHLLNFFHTSKAAPSNDTGADFYRLFDYVETPSPFVGAERWYNPLTTNVAADLAAATFRPPYNNLSRFQNPGVTNINTIFDSRVWEGLCKGYPALDPFSIGGPMFNRFLESRRGYPGTPLQLDSDYPTLFANPFRSADSADLMPDVANLRKREPIQATLLREDRPASRTEALFIPDRAAVPVVLDPYQNQDRNSFFRYHGLARLSNLVGNNSNVFAVWITLGYFEVEASSVDLAHPDGYRLGPELGTDSGQVKRHRAFYIIDRSVPVAFEPGQNHNVDKAILLRRFIE